MSCKLQLSGVACIDGLELCHSVINILYSKNDIGLCKFVVSSGFMLFCKCCLHFVNGSLWWVCFENRPKFAVIMVLVSWFKFVFLAWFEGEKKSSCCWGFMVMNEHKAQNVDDHWKIEVLSIGRETTENQFGLSILLIVRTKLIIAEGKWHKLQNDYACWLIHQLIRK